MVVEKAELTAVERDGWTVEMLAWMQALRRAAVSVD